MLSIMKLIGLMLVGVVLVVGCVRNETFKLPDSYYQSTRAASRAIAEQLAPQLDRLQKPWENRNIVIGDFINTQTAEMTTSGHDLHAMLLLDLRQDLPDLKVSALSADSSLQNAIAIQGTTLYVPNRGKSDAASWFKVVITATDLENQQKVGEAAVFVNARHFDPIPSRFFRDAPMYLVGSRHKKRLAAISGNGSNLRSVLQTDAFVTDAVAEYEKANYSVSEKKFKFILDAGDKSNLVALSGLYQSYIKQKKLSEAERAFGFLLKETIDDNNISVKFLFRVRSKEFRDEGDLETQYAIWLRQIAHQIFTSGKCLDINGHASKSGSAEFNDGLSLLRAQWVREQMVKVEPRLASRLKAHGKGFRENVIGSGSDNALDAIDRRVDFVLTTCR